MTARATANVMVKTLRPLRAPAVTLLTHTNPCVCRCRAHLTCRPTHDARTAAVVRFSAGEAHKASDSRPAEAHLGPAGDGHPTGPRRRVSTSRGRNRAHPCPRRVPHLSQRRVFGMPSPGLESRVRPRAVHAQVPRGQAVDERMKNSLSS